MRLCPYCENEVVGIGEDCIDFCRECGIVVEGETIDVEKEKEAFKRNPTLEWKS